METENTEEVTEAIELTDREQALLDKLLSANNPEQANKAISELVA